MMEMGIAEKKISGEEVISKIKDDGDFDRIRLNIVRILKQNEDLRNNIISAVKESAALNHAGAENMTPRQLCDAIHDEISENVMVQISEGLWQIIRSEESITTEITETVKSVYDKLLKPECEEPPGFSLQNHSNHDFSQFEKHEVHPINGKTVERRKSCRSNGPLQTEDGDSRPPPGFVLQAKCKRNPDSNDKDPDIPPGFG